MASRGRARPREASAEVFAGGRAHTPTDFVGAADTDAVKVTGG